MADSDIVYSVFKERMKHSLLTNDGRTLSVESLGFRRAVKLANDNPAGNADEIIGLMKPFCMPFNISEVRQELVAHGAAKKNEQRIRA